MLPRSTDVLIVGAGPVGLTLAIALRRAGVDYLLIDKLGTAQNTSRAAVIHAHTLEMLEELGVAERLIAAGCKLASFAIRDRERALLRLDFTSLPTRHPYLLMLPQDATERILGDELSRLGGTIHRNVLAEPPARSGAAARVPLVADDKRQTVAARFVVGADGMHSVVRQSAGIAFAGGSYEESFVLADVEMDWPAGRKEVSLFFSPAGLLVVAPLPRGIFRIVATMSDAPEHPSLADVQAIVAARGLKSGMAQVSHMIWSSRFRIHHRVAQSYRSGPFLLAGDAAHVHSPAGGQGMNTGIIDASVLGKLLAAVTVGSQPEAILDLYEALRRPAEDEVQHLAARMTNLATMKGGGKRAIRNLALRLVNHLPGTKARLAMNLSGLSRRNSARLPDYVGIPTAQLPNQQSAGAEP